MQDKKQLSVNPMAAGPQYPALHLPSLPPSILLLFALSLPMHLSAGVPGSHAGRAPGMAAGEASEQRLGASWAHQQGLAAELHIPLSELSAPSVKFTAADEKESPWC